MHYVIDDVINQDPRLGLVLISVPKQSMSNFENTHPRRYKIFYIGPPLAPPALRLGRAATFARPPPAALPPRRPPASSAFRKIRLPARMWGGSSWKILPRRYIGAGVAGGRFGWAAAGVRLGGYSGAFSRNRFRATRVQGYTITYRASRPSVRPSVGSFEVLSVKSEGDDALRLSRVHGRKRTGASSGVFMGGSDHLLSSGLHARSPSKNYIKKSEYDIHSMRWHSERCASRGQGGGRAAFLEVRRAFPKSITGLLARVCAVPVCASALRARSFWKWRTHRRRL
ncbi:hypothetical protein EVAR_61656_1 [Eumeta japonica]|uniref:Uncharacterized protein n=1 Tax=Eumeta variegata TaxID=151549 RepID=A0A4C1Z9Z6_EUMVA|nr:hypothetical protein EVAR_61656_1 [Eumeta japonica]